MKTLAEIQSILGEHKSALLKKYPIYKMAIFGSYARNEHKQRSDLDILIEFNGKIGIRFVDLAEELEELTGVDIDLVSKNGIRKKYFQAIRSELIYV